MLSLLCLGSCSGKGYVVQGFGFSGQYNGISTNLSTQHFPIVQSYTNRLNYIDRHLCSSDHLAEQNRHKNLRETPIESQQIASVLSEFVDDFLVKAGDNFQMVCTACDNKFLSIFPRRNGKGYLKSHARVKCKQHIQGKNHKINVSKLNREINE